MAAPRELSTDGPPIDPARELWSGTIRARDFGPEGIIIEADAGTKPKDVVADMLRGWLDAGTIDQDEYDRYVDEDYDDWYVSADAGPFTVGARGGNLRDRLMPPRS